MQYILYDFNHTIVGGIMPLGMLKDTAQKDRWGSYHYMQYSEYIVENPAQVCLRYLVEFRHVSSRHWTRRFYEGIHSLYGGTLEVGKP